MFGLSIKTWAIILAILVTFFGMITLAVFEFAWIENTLAAKKMIAIFAAVGAVSGIVLGHYFAKSKDDVIDRTRIYGFFLLLGLLSMPIMGSLANRLLSFSKFELREVELFAQKGYMADLGLLEGDVQQGADGVFTFVIIDGKLERFKSKKVLFPDAKKGDQVSLKMKKGLFGFWVIDTR